LNYICAPLPVDRKPCTVHRKPCTVKHLIVIGGATATGKTRTAIRLARELDTAILSADSRQFYREMSIGTAKPSAEERAMAPHYFVDSLSVEDDYSVGDFERDALALLDQLFLRHDAVILSGGSGLFIDALCAGLDDFPAISPETRAWVRAGEESGGLPWLQQTLERLDPVANAAIDRQNPARLRRALQVSREAGRPYSEFLKREKKPRPFQSDFLLLEWPREELYRRIDARVDQMLDAGLEAEARSLLPYRHRPALRTVGYQEWFDHFDGKISRAEAMEKIKQHTRNYAKRQATWFRKHGDWKVFHPDQDEAIRRWAREVVE
jgi:tRNA dimethylallyltransferase